MSLSSRYITVSCSPGDIGTSSQTISDASRIFRARSDCNFTVEVESSVSVPNGTPNIEWTVLPPSMSEAAIPVYATDNAVRPRLCRHEIKQLYNVVLPVPPGPSTKNSLATILSSSTVRMTRSYTAPRCCSLRLSSRWTNSTASSIRSKSRRPSAGNGNPKSYCAVGADHG